jgi:hypothetical protein
MEQFSKFIAGGYGTSIAAKYDVDQYGRIKVLRYQAYVPGAAGSLCVGSFETMAEAIACLNDYIAQVFRIVDEFPYQPEVTTAPSSPGGQ